MNAGLVVHYGDGAAQKDTVGALGSAATATGTTSTTSTSSSDHIFTKLEVPRLVEVLESTEVTLEGAQGRLKEGHTMEGQQHSWEDTCTHAAIVQSIKAAQEVENIAQDVMWSGHIGHGRQGTLHLMQDRLRHAPRSRTGTVDGLREPMNAAQLQRACWRALAATGNSLINMVTMLDWEVIQAWWPLTIQLAAALTSALVWMYRAAAGQPMLALNTDHVSALGWSPAMFESVHPDAGVNAAAGGTAGVVDAEEDKLESSQTDAAGVGLSIDTTSINAAVNGGMLTRDRTVLPSCLVALWILVSSPAAAADPVAAAADSGGGAESSSTADKAAADADESPGGSGETMRGTEAIGNAGVLMRAMRDAAGAEWVLENLFEFKETCDEMWPGKNMRCPSPLAPHSRLFPPRCRAAPVQYGRSCSIITQSVVLLE